MREEQRAGPASRDKRMLAAASHGDRVAFGELYEEHVRDVYRYALRMLQSTGDAEDITQDVFTIAWTDRARIRIVDRSMLPWLLVTARNLSLNRLKRTARQSDSLESTEHVDPRPGPEAALLDSQLSHAIDAAVSRLSAIDQRLYRLCLVDDLSYGDAAAALGITTGAVRNRLSRLRRALQVSLTTNREGLL
jgi:RNA polymerase sigma factor (sigma-70 family)